MRSLIFKRAPVALACVAGLALLVGCGNGESPTTRTDRPEDEKSDQPSGQAPKPRAARDEAPPAQPKDDEGLTIDRYYLTLDTYTMDPRYLDEPGVTLGDGIDLRDPHRPLVAPCRAFVALEKEEPETTEATETEQPGLLTSKFSVTENAKFLECRSDEEEKLVLSAHFKATYMLSSVQAAAKVSSETKKDFHTIYLLIEHVGEARRLPASGRKWAADVIPVSESIPDDDEALRQFVSHYGTHYVSTIRYGLRIGVQGKREGKETTAAQSLSVAFKAAFGSFGAEGGVDAEHKNTLTSENVDLVLEATSGGREDNGLLVAQGFDDIHQLLSDASTGKIKFHVAPLEVTLKPYWPTLDPKWERTRSLLDPSLVSFKVPGAPYGVPKGTIVAWHPTPDYVKMPVKAPEDETPEAPEDESPEEPTIVPPPGWAICDGTKGTPDLRGRFIRGTAAYASLGDEGGQDKHGHGTHAHKTVATTDVQGIPGGGAAHHLPSGGHTHKVEGSAVPEAEHLPPYVQLVYIMKLDDVP